MAGQVGPYLPEHRALRTRVGAAAGRDPAVAAELTAQPVRRFHFDAAPVFTDPSALLEAMGLDAGPEPMGLRDLAETIDLAVDRVGHVAETVRLVRAELPGDVAVVAVADAPTTLLARLLDGAEGLRLRRAMALHRGLLREVLDRLAASIHGLLRVQIEAGADAAQLLDPVAGTLPVASLRARVFPAAAAALRGLGVPTIYSAQGVHHGLEHLRTVYASCYGIDWRRPLVEVWAELGHDVAVHGNLEPAVLLTDPTTVAEETRRLLGAVGGRPGHVVDVGHEVDPSTPIENVAALVKAVRDGRPPPDRRPPRVG